MNALMFCIWILCVFHILRNIWWQNSPVCKRLCTVDASAGLGPNGGEDGVDNGEGGEQAAFTVQGLQGGWGDGASG